MTSENKSRQSRIYVTQYWLLRAKCQKASLNSQPSASMCGGGGQGAQFSPNISQSCDKETDGQHNTCGGSSGRPSALLQSSYFTANQQNRIYYNIILGLGKMMNSQDRFPYTLSKELTCSITLLSRWYTCQGCFSRMRPCGASFVSKYQYVLLKNL